MLFIEKVLGIDLSNMPIDYYAIVYGIEPKIKFKNESLQKIAIKLFGYKMTYKTVKAKRIDINCKDVPIQDWDGTFTFTYGEEGEIKT